MSAAEEGRVIGEGLGTQPKDQHDITTVIAVVHVPRSGGGVQLSAVAIPEVATSLSVNSSTDSDDSATAQISAAREWMASSVTLVQYNLGSAPRKMGRASRCGG
jgi:hypothetical protein